MRAASRAASMCDRAQHSISIHPVPADMVGVSTLLSYVVFMMIKLKVQVVLPIFRAFLQRRQRAKYGINLPRKAINKTFHTHTDQGSWCVHLQTSHRVFKAFRRPRFANVIDAIITWLQIQVRAVWFSLWQQKSVSGIWWGSQRREDRCKHSTDKVNSNQLLHKTWAI